MNPTGETQDWIKMQMEDHSLLIRLETKVDSFITSQNDHEVRLRTLEKDAEGRDGSLRALKWLVGALGTLAAIIEPLVAWYVGTHK